jgi:hypothetical protein
MRFCQTLGYEGDRNGDMCHPIESLRRASSLLAFGQRESSMEYPLDSICELGSNIALGVSRIWSCLHVVDQDRHSGERARIVCKSMIVHSLPSFSSVLFCSAPHGQ